MALVAIMLVALGVVALVSAAVWAYYHFENKRKAAFQAVAQRNGWSYSPKDEGDRPRVYREFRPFGIGHSRRARHVLAGRMKGVPFEAFEYLYTVQQGKNSHTEIVGVATCPMPWDIGALTVEPEHWGHKVYDALGGEDIDFESDEFSRAFWVRCGDRRAAYDVLHPPMMQFLLENPHAGAWQWRGRTLLLHRRGALKPATVEGFVASLAGFVGRLPRHRLAEAGPKTEEGRKAPGAAKAAKASPRASPKAKAGAGRHR